MTMNERIHNLLQRAGVGVNASVSPIGVGLRGNRGGMAANR